MKKIVSLIAVLATLIPLFGAEKSAESKKLSGAEIPVSGFAKKEQGREKWKDKYESDLKEAREKGKKVKLVFLGDSRVVLLKDRKVWKDFEYCNPMTIGYGGDRTQHTLWLVEKSGIFELIEPKLIVIQIGVNNNFWRDHFTVEETTRAIARIISDLRQKEPQAKILLFGIFQMGEKPTHRCRKIVAGVNSNISKFADGKNVFYEDINDKFIKKDGYMDKSLFPDTLHPNEAGCKIWFDAIRPYVYKYVGKPDSLKK